MNPPIEPPANDVLVHEDPLKTLEPVLDQLDRFPVGKGKPEPDGDSQGVKLP